MTTLTATVFVGEPDSFEADFYVKLPPIHRKPVLLEDWQGKLRDYVNAAVACGFTYADGKPFPVASLCDATEAVKSAVSNLSFPDKFSEYPVVMCVAFQENRLIPRKIKYEALDVYPLSHRPIPDDIPFVLVYPRGEMPTRFLISNALAKNGLGGTSPEAALFNLDYTNDKESYRKAEQLTDALYAAIEEIAYSQLVGVKKALEDGSLTVDGAIVVPFRRVY